MIKYIATTVKGVKREINEDRIMINNHLLSEGTLDGSKKKSIVAVICDGVGGVRGGAEAAEIAAKRFKDIPISEISPLWIIKRVDLINKEIMDKQDDTSSKIMASTIAGIIMFDSRFIAFNSGDTRVYEITNDRIIKHTKDHIFNTGKKSILTNYIGGSGTMCSPYIKKGELITSDSFIVMCSDGIYKSIPDLEMHQIIESNRSLEEKSESIIELSTQNGSTDDKSLIIVHFSQ